MVSLMQCNRLLCLMPAKYFQVVHELYESKKEKLPERSHIADDLWNFVCAWITTVFHWGSWYFFEIMLILCGCCFFSNLSITEWNIFSYDVHFIQINRNFNEIQRLQFWILINHWAMSISMKLTLLFEHMIPFPSHQSADCVWVKPIIL